MNEYKVTFENKHTSTIIGTDRDDALAYADRIAKGMKITSLVEVRAPRKSCHYCGMPADDFNFFDAPVCDGCR